MLNSGAINKTQITTGTLKEYYFSKQLTITSSWQDTGISSTNLETGLYAIRVNNIYVTSKSWQISSQWGGILMWFSGGTNSSEASDVYMVNCGHAHNGDTIQLRTLTHGSGVATLQIKSATTSSYVNTAVNFYLTKLC